MQVLYNSELAKRCKGIRFEFRVGHYHDFIIFILFNYRTPWFIRLYKLHRIYFELACNCCPRRRVKDTFTLKCFDSCTCKLSHCQACFLHVFFCLADYPQPFNRVSKIELRIFSNWQIGRRIGLSANNWDAILTSEEMERKIRETVKSFKNMTDSALAPLCKYLSDTKFQIFVSLHMIVMSTCFIYQQNDEEKVLSTTGQVRHRRDATRTRSSECICPAGTYNLWPVFMKQADWRDCKLNLWAVLWSQLTREFLAFNPIAYW